MFSFSANYCQSQSHYVATNTQTIVSLEHLLHYHMHWGNIPAMALRKFLQPNHPLREALTRELIMTPLYSKFKYSLLTLTLLVAAHFFQTHSTCVSSKYNLIHETGPLGRALPFAYENGYLVRSPFDSLFWAMNFLEIPSHYLLISSSHS